jgi:hypothetical protein
MTNKYPQKEVIKKSEKIYAKTIKILVLGSRACTLEETG